MVVMVPRTIHTPDPVVLSVGDIKVARTVHRHPWWDSQSAMRPTAGPPSPL